MVVVVRVRERERERIYISKLFCAVSIRARSCRSPPVNRVRKAEPKLYRSTLAGVAAAAAVCWQLDVWVCVWLSFLLRGSFQTVEPLTQLEKNLK